MNRPASQVVSQDVLRAPGIRVPRMLRQFACAAALLAAPSAARAQDIAVYGAEIPPGFASAIGRIFDQAGQVEQTLIFEAGVGSGSFGVNANIEDIACDAYGRVYALGKPGASGLRTVYKSSPTGTYMHILFQTVQNYDATVDGSIAISPTGNVAIYGAHSVSTFGSSLKVFDQAGNAVNELLFQTGVGTSVFSVSTTIEDIAYDAAGNLYAVGKDHQSSLRTIFKQSSNLMYVLFQKSLAYSSTVDGSIAIAPTGDISVYGAQSVSTFGTSLQTYDQAGTVLSEKLFQNSVGGSSWGVNPNIEDIAYDSDGNLYAVGKPGSSSLLSVFKSAPNGLMDILFQSTGNWTTAVDGSIAIAPFTAWSAEGFGVYGSDEIPELEAFGTLAVGSSNQIRLSHAVPNSIATMFIGFQELSALFKGGVLYPKATLALALATDANGMSVLPFVMPAGAPSGAEIYMQCWQPDPAAFKGFAATNGLKGVVP